VREHVPDGVALATAILDTDPLSLLPKRIPRLPDWAKTALAVPVRLADGTPLPQDAVESAIIMLMMSGPVEPYAGVSQLAQLCDVTTLNQLSWTLFESWWKFGAPAAHRWALDALAWFADDESVDRIADMIEYWPGEGRSGRVPHGLDVLSTIGSDHALLRMFRMSQKARSRPLRGKAAERLSEIASLRGLSDDQLADRLVPDLGLDDASALELDYGPRRFTIDFDELLRPQVRDQDGALLRALPKPGTRDDAVLADDAYRRFTRLKREIRTVAKEQVRRLETAMIHERHWDTEEFEMLFVGHPVLVHLARRLIWAQFDTDSALQFTFRVAEDQSYAGADDDAVQLDPTWTIGLAHPLHVSDRLASWSSLLADYDILQPFPQTRREIISAAPADLDGSTLARFENAQGTTFGLMGLGSRGWTIGEPLDGAMRNEITRPAPGGHTVNIWLDPGIPPDPREVQNQSVQVSVDGATFADLGEIFTSEVITDLTRALGA
jgi:hypothetical protein